MNKALNLLLPPNRPDERETLKEERELKDLLNLDDSAFTEGKLQFIEPDKWKNVGVSIVHAVKILKEHNAETAEYMAQLHQFLLKFHQKVIHFIHYTDQDLIQLRQKTTKDVATISKETEEKIKAFKQLGDANLVTMRDAFDVQLDESAKKVEECWNKINKIKPTELVLKEVHKTIESKLSGLHNQITDLSSSVSARFLKLYQEELWEESWFGPLEGDKFRSLKDYALSNFLKVNSALNKLD